MGTKYKEPSYSDNIPQLNRYCLYPKVRRTKYCIRSKTINIVRTGYSGLSSLLHPHFRSQWSDHQFIRLPGMKLNQNWLKLLLSIRARGEGVRIDKGGDFKREL